MVRVPQRAVLIAEHDERTVRPGPGPTTRRHEQHQGQEAHDLGFVGHQVAQHAAETHGLVAEVVACELVARRRRVALVEDEVDDGEDRAQAVGQLGAAGDAVGNARTLDLRLGPADALRHRRLGDQEGAGDLRGGQAAQQAKGERDLGRRRQRGMAAGEDEPEAVVLHGKLLV